MGRPPGARNRAHDQRREELLTRLLPAIVKEGGKVSLHELARVSNASIPTLKHYFGDRSGVVAEALRAVRNSAAVYISSIAAPGDLDLQASLVKLASELVEAWVHHGVGALFAAGLSAGLQDEQAGPGYVDGVLEPTLMALEARLRVHAERGQLKLCSDDGLAIRTAAMAFLSPLFVALLHQHSLFGARCRPLDLDAFITLHTASYVQAYGTAARPKT